MTRQTASGKLITHDGHVVQICPFLEKRTTAYNPNCVQCYEGQCSRMSSIGLDTLGNPLPEGERPICGARTRSGDACEMPVVPGKRRCRAHGGLSTGPKTEAGRERIRLAQKRRWERSKSEISENVAQRNDSQPVRASISSEERATNAPRKKRPWPRTKRISPMAL